jgi:hypothetical protein
MKLIVPVFVPILIGSIGLSMLAHNPRFEMYRSVDVLQLLASGACFGVALSGMAAMILGRRVRSR